MTATNLLTELERLGVHVEARGDKLHLDAPKGSLTTELVSMLRSHKVEVLEALGGRVVEDAAKSPSSSHSQYEVPVGWSRRAWVDRLEQLALACEENVSDRAVELRKQADGLRREGTVET